MMRRFLDRLAGPRSPIYTAALAVVLLLPALGVGFLMDDHLHRLVLGGRTGVDLQPYQVFSSLSGDPAVNRSLIESGVLPWWTAPDLRLAFFRPLSVLTMRLDHALWPRSAPLMHAHSLAWLGLLVAAACVLYRRVLGAGWIAGLAGLLYAVDESHAIAAAWLANRNALLATSFGILCLLAHDRARREGWRPGAIGRRLGLPVGRVVEFVLAPLCLALCLLSGEIGLGVLGYLLAHAAFLDRAPWRARVLALVPSGVVAAAWAATYRGLGFGTHGSGLYLDPLGDTSSFLHALPDRAAFLLLGQWSPLPARLGNMSPEIVRPTRWIALVVVGLVAFAVVPLVRRSATARFFCLGMVLSIVPCVSAFPDNRLLFFTGLGAMGLLAEFLGGLARPAAWLPTQRAWCIPARALAAFWIVTHLVLAPLLTPAAAVVLRRIGRRLDVALDGLPAQPSLVGRTLVVANSPDYLLTVTDLRVTQLLEGRPVPARMRALYAGTEPAELTRLDERTLHLRVERGLYHGMLGRLFRDAARPLRAGDRVELSDLSVEVLRLTEDERPQEMIFRFNVPLEDPSLAWVEWRAGRYVSFTPPEPGRSLTLPAPEDLFGRALAG